MLKSKPWLLIRHVDQIDPKTEYKINTHISQKNMCVNIMREYNHNTQSLEGEQWNKTDQATVTMIINHYMVEMANDPRIIGILHRLQDVCERENKHIHKYSVFHFYVFVFNLLYVCVCI